jgi:hypothetical protein
MKASRIDIAVDPLPPGLPPLLSLPRWHWRSGCGGADLVGSGEGGTILVL